MLAVTFTRKAAAELHDRLRTLGIRDQLAAGTFHGLAYAQLRGLWTDRGTTPPELLDRKIGIIARLIGGERGADPLDVVSEVEWVAARMVPPPEYPRAAAASGRRPPRPPADGRAAQGLRGPQAQPRTRRLRRPPPALSAQPAIRRGFAARHRWRFRHFFVDEFQDVNPLQFTLLQGWLDDRAGYVCVVGDPNQAIYGWNGADASYLRGFDQYFQVAVLCHSPRTTAPTPQVVAAANAVICITGATAARLPGRVQRGTLRPSPPTPMTERKPRRSPGRSRQGRGPNRR